jgi:tripartite-type tricarboxylate transporter receptor subunit TctC
VPTIIRVLVSFAVLFLGTAASAQPYPNKPVKLIVPFPAGGPADLIARIVGQKLSEDFGKQFYVENHSGAGGNLGVGIGARARADGYSLLVTSQAFVINASLYKSLPYDPDKDFMPITRVANTPNVIVVHPSVPAKTVKELVALIRGNDPKYHSYAQPGLGTPSHLSGELFRLSEKLNFTAVPFGGGGPMILSVVAGHTPIAFSSLAPAAQQIQSGNLRALAVTAEKRVESLPDVPTMTEAGFPGQVGETPIGILAPTGAPQEVIDIIHRKITAIIAQPEIKQRLSTLGFSPVGDTPAEFAATLKAEGVKWAEVIRQAGINLQ